MAELYLTMHYLSAIFLTLHTAGSIQKSFKQNSLDLNMAANFQNKIRPWMFSYYLVNPGLSNSKVLCCLRNTKRISIPQRNPVLFPFRVAFCRSKHHRITMIEQTRLRLQNNGIPDSDHYMKTLVAASINEDNYFNNLLGNDIAKIAKDLRDAPEKDSDTGDPITPVEDMLGTFEELKKTDNATQAQMIMYSKLFKINFTKMDPYEFKTFTDILQRYSDLCKPVRGNGRGRKKK